MFRQCPVSGSGPRLRLIGSCLALAVLSSFPLWAQKSRSAAEATRLLRDGERLFRRGEALVAARMLRQLVSRVPDTSVSRQARALLARNGFGTGFRVVLRDRRNLHRLAVTEAAIVELLEDRFAALEVFFRQIYDGDPRPAVPPLEIVVHDSRARFRAAFGGTPSRSFLEFPARPRAEHGPTARLAVFHDSRVASRRDNLILIGRSALRDVALVMARTSSRHRLPPALETGLCEFLAVRLFPARLEGLSQTVAGILGSFARAGLQRIDRLAVFRTHLASRNPAGTVAPTILWQWTGLSYAVVDFLVAGCGEQQSGPVVQGELTDTVRIMQFQALLRDFDVLWRGRGKTTAASPVPLLEKLLRRHFDMTLGELHRGVLERARRYPPMEPDIEGITD